MLHFYSLLVIKGLLLSQHIFSRFYSKHPVNKKKTLDDKRTIKARPCNFFLIINICLKSLPVSKNFAGLPFGCAVLQIQNM